jgi:predicted enzyme related to lactoylglutathione lyase
MARVTGIGGKFAWILDPEGNKVELWEPMTWDEKNKSA